MNGFKSVSTLAMIVYVFAVIGWFMNLYKTVVIAFSGVSLDVVGVELVVRLVGLFVAPLGSVMGFF